MAFQQTIKHTEYVFDVELGSINCCSVVSDVSSYITLQYLHHTYISMLINLIIFLFFMCPNRVMLHAITTAPKC